MYTSINNITFDGLEKKLIQTEEKLYLLSKKGDKSHWPQFKQIQIRS